MLSSLELVAAFIIIFSRVLLLSPLLPSRLMSYILVQMAWITITILMLCNSFLNHASVQNPTNDNYAAQ